MQVRMATTGDAAALSRIHAETWEHTYVGRVPDALARERIAKARARNWAEHGEMRTGAGGGVVVLTRDQDVVGFCEFGPTEDADDDPRRVGHIMRLYIHPLHQGHGGGKLLVEAACARLARDGYEDATLWTPEDPANRACGFYAHLGWTDEGIRNSEQPPDVRYRRRLSPPPMDCV
jgi:GNAT superfamily N-acetyltransferase